VLETEIPIVLGAMTPLGIALVTILIAVEMGLLVYALVDLYRRPAAAVTGGNRLVWLLLCVFFQMIGPILYLTVGRTAAPPQALGSGAAAAGDHNGTPRAIHVAQAAAALYDAGGARAVPSPADGSSPGVETPPGPRGAAVELSALRKVFAGAVALDGLTLSVPEGSVFGFLGPNGAGKTTTLRILAGLARPTTGATRVFGRDVAGGSAEMRSLVGYLPDVPAFYKWMTGAEYLRFAGSLFSLRGADLTRRVDELLELSGLAGVDVKIRGYSRGMKQRLGVAQALVNAPRLLLLDEPTSALDPIGRREILDMIISLRGRTTVFFSTHILADVERVCDTVAIIDHGRVAALAGIDELRRRRGGFHRLSVDVDDDEALARELREAPWVRGLQPGESGGLLVSVDDLEAAQREIPAAVARLGLALRRLEGDELSLEDVFVDLVGGGAR
jgi:ABC-2 type transport system ATP-binding protein